MCPFRADVDFDRCDAPHIFNGTARFAVRVVPLIFLHFQGEQLVADCPPVVVRCFCESSRPSTQEMMDRARIFLANGGLWLRSASRDKVSPCWASWADEALPTIRERHSSIGPSIQRCGGGPHVVAVMSGFDCTSPGVSSSLGRLGLPAGSGTEVRHCMLKNNSAQGWCGRVFTMVSRHSFVPRAGLSQGSRSVVSRLLQRFVSSPRSSARIASSDVSSCRCGRPLDSKWPPPRSLSSRRGFVFYRERGGSRVQRGQGDSDNERARSGLGSATQSRSRQQPVVGDGLPLFHGVQFAIDTTMVFPVRRDGSPRWQCATGDGVSMAHRKSAPIPNLPRLTEGRGGCL